MSWFAMHDLSKAETPLPLRILVPLIVACALFMENLDATVLSTALPAIAKDLHEDPIQLKLALTSYLLTLAVFIPASGWFADRFGARLIFRLAIIIFAIGSACCGFARSIEFLVMARALQGVGGAMMVPVGRLVILRTVPRAEIVGALAWLTIPALIGPVIGPPIGGFIATFFTWRWIFWINLPIAALGLTLASLFIPDVFGEERAPFDFAGFLFSGLGLSALVSASAALDANLDSPLFVAALFAVGIAGVVLYVRHARRTSAPILDLDLLRYPTFRAGALGGSLFRIGVGAVPLLLPLLLQLGFGFSPLRSGLLTFVTALGAIGMKVAAAKVLRKWGFRRVLIFNSVVSAIFIAAPAAFTPAMPVLLIVVVLFVGGFFRSLEFTCINAISYAEIEQPKMSAATSLQSVLQQFSLSLGVTVGASALQLTMAFHDRASLTQADFWPAFLVIGAISFLATFSFARLSEYAGEELAGRKQSGSVQVNISNARG
jgi:EmrB/QacA subfamily drug resistance transporter